MDIDLGLFEESDKKALVELSPVKQKDDKEFLPVSYKVFSFGFNSNSTYQRELLDTYLVSQGYFEMAKGLAVKKAKMTGNCIVIELTKKAENINGRMVIKTVERVVIEVKERQIESKTIMYKSGHKRKRGFA